MSTDAILKDIAAKKFSPLYLLHGPEPYYIDRIAEAIEEQALEEHEKAFNMTILYGKDVDHRAVKDAAQRFPMMAARQVVILREAQEMKTLKDLEDYVDKPAPTTVLVICHKYKNLPMNTRLGKLLKQRAVVFESKALYDNQVPEWVENYLKEKKLRIQPQAAELLAEYLGTDLAKITNELDKLALNLAPGTTVDVPQIEANIGISKDYNVFELQRALGQREIGKANRIVNYFAANPRKNPLPVIIGSLYGYFSKVYLLHGLKQASEQDILTGLGLRSKFFLREYQQAARHYPPRRTEDIIGLLHEYDLKSKGVDYNATGKPEGELLREMVWKIVHGS